MPDSKYSALPAVVTPDGAIEWGVNQGGVSRRMTRDQANALEVGEHFVLPLENDAITPSLGFGGGADGFYQRTDTAVAAALAGVWSYDFNTTNLSAVVSGGFQASLRRVTPTAIIPSVVPSVLISSDTGLGLAAAGQLSLIAGAIEGVRVRTAASGVNFLDVTPSAAGAPVLLGVEGSDVDIDLQLIPKGTGGVGIGTAAADELLHIAKAVDGSFVGLLIENSQAASGGSTNETAEIRFGFGGDNDVARISADKRDDYTTTAQEDSRLSFWVEEDGVLTEIVHVMDDGLMLIQPSSNIRFVGTAGGSGSIQYKDSTGSNRSAFLFAGSDVVAVVNRAANGIVEIRANTSTGGNPGEVTVATFEDDLVKFETNIEIGSEGGGTRRLAIKGSDATGTDEGGEIQIYLADDFDTTITNYVIDAFQDDLRFFGAGGTPNMTLTAEGYLVLTSGAKTDTGDPASREGMIYWNTFDNVIRMFADGAWRTLASW